MSLTSNWPLDDRSIRLVSPVVIRRLLEQHPLARDCYPLAAGYYETAHDHSMSRRRHYDNILIYCFAGRGHLYTGGWSGTVKAGELILLPSGTGHRYRADRDTPWSIYWCHFSGTLAPNYIAHMDPAERRPVIPIGHSPALIAQFQSLLSAAGSGYDIAALVHAANMLKQMLTSLAMIIAEASSDRKEAFNIAGIQAFMLQNLDKPVTLEVLAEQAELSKYHFARKYKQATGFTPIEHLITMKIEYSRYLLETSDTAVAEIARKAGYEDALYFSRQFARRMGVSPTEYRQGRTFATGRQQPS